MKKSYKFFLPAILLPAILMLWSFNPPKDAYIVISWNDLGMHCANANFQNLCILPPYNNIKAQVIKVGNSNTPPEVLTTNYNVSYEIPGNTYSVGKTNFWDYANQIFGVNLQPNIGLTGAGLSGDMAIDGNNFFVDGVPLTPYPDNDLNTEHPFQLGMIQAYDAQNNLIASTQPVIPVSNEINCVSAGCHSSETAILNAHEDEGGFDPNATPILCAECHSDNALGMPGHPGVPAFSRAIHSAHGEETNDCYKCHPGPNTQCLRGVMFGHGMICQDCHGSVSHVGQTIAQGREPWLQEPSCGDASCHGSNYAEEPGLLFRQSKGHGNLYCSVCHGEPHAILPSTNANDNVQVTALQGYAGILTECVVCHGYVPTAPGPHGYIPTAIETLPGVPNNSYSLEQNYPNPVQSKTKISFSIPVAEKAYLDIYDMQGKRIARILSEHMQPGNFSMDYDASSVANGTYFYTLKSGKFSESKKMIVNH
jgi:hypothetical protein